MVIIRIHGFYNLTANKGFHNLKRQLVLFISTLSLWIVLAGRVNFQIFLVGAFVSSTISIIYAKHLRKSEQLEYKSKKFVVKIGYSLWLVTTLISDLLLSAVRISKFAFAINPTFSPRIVKVKTSLEKSKPIETLANFITLPQGTVAIDIDSFNRNYTIHWIDVQSDRDAEKKKAVIYKHENFVSKIFN